MRKRIWKGSQRASKRLWNHGNLNGKFFVFCVTFEHPFKFFHLSSSNYLLRL